MAIWQKREWCEMLIKTGQVEKIIQTDGIYIQKRKVSMGEFGLFVMGIKKISKLNPNILIDICKKEKALFIQIETINYSITYGSSETINDFERGYYKKFITPYTAIIDLNFSLDEILNNMKPKGRYNIKLAEKKGVTSSIVEKTNQNIEKFYDIVKETTKRDNFSAHNLDYYKIFLTQIKKSELILAEKDGKIIAGGIFIFGGKFAIYYYGASTSNKAYRNLMAPYLVQWTAIKYAKETNSQIYDFLGISGYDEEHDPSLEGVTGFKMKLASEGKKVSNSYIYINKKLRYKYIAFLKKLKKFKK